MSIRSTVRVPAGSENTLILSIPSSRNSGFSLFSVQCYDGDTLSSVFSSMDMQTPPQPPAPPMPPTGGGAPGASDDVEKNKVLAAISYLWIVSLIILLVKKDSPFAQFHAKQGFVLFIAAIVFGFIPLIGMLLNLVVFVFALIGLISALQGKWRKLPLIAPIAEKINF